MVYFGTINVFVEELSINSTFLYKKIYYGVEFNNNQPELTY